MKYAKGSDAAIARHPNLDGCDDSRMTCPRCGKILVRTFNLAGGGLQLPWAERAELQRCLGIRQKYLKNKNIGINGIVTRAEADAALKAAGLAFISKDRAEDSRDRWLKEYVDKPLEKAKRTHPKLFAEKKKYCRVQKGTARSHQEVKPSW